MCCSRFLFMICQHSTTSLKLKHKNLHAQLIHACIYTWHKHMHLMKIFIITPIIVVVTDDPAFIVKCTLFILNAPPFPACWFASLCYMSPSHRVLLNGTTFFPRPQRSGRIAKNPPQKTFLYLPKRSVSFSHRCSSTVQ